MGPFRSALSYLLVVVLGACSTVDPVGMPAGISQPPSGQGGVLFGSLGVGMQTPYTQQGLRYRLKGKKESALIVFRESGIGIGDTPIDFTEGAAKGSVFAIRLPPGEYELCNVYFFVNRGQYGSASFTAKNDFSIPFRVTEGDATYLGEFLTYSTTGKNFLGMSVPGGGYFVVNDKLERDYALLGKKGIVIPKERVIDSTIDTSSIHLPIFQANPGSSK